MPKEYRNVKKLSCIESFDSINDRAIYQCSIKFENNNEDTFYADGLRMKELCFEKNYVNLSGVQYSFNQENVTCISDEKNEDEGYDEITLECKIIPTLEDYLEEFE